MAGPKVADLRGLFEAKDAAAAVRTRTPSPGLGGMSADQVARDRKITKEVLKNFLDAKKIAYPKSASRDELIRLAIGASAARPKSPGKKPVTLDVIKKIMALVQDRNAAALRTREFTNDMLLAALSQMGRGKAPSKSKKDDIIRYLLGDQIPARSPGRTSSAQDTKVLAEMASGLLSSRDRAMYRDELLKLTLKDIRVIGAEIRRIQKERKQPVFSFSGPGQKPAKKEDYVDALIALRPRQPRTKSGPRSPKVVSPIVQQMLDAAMSEAQKKVTKREMAASCARSGSVIPSARSSARRSGSSSPPPAASSAGSPGSARSARSMRLGRLGSLLGLDS